MTAGVVHVVEFHQRPVAGAGGEALVPDLIEERDRCLIAQGRKRPVANGIVESPELKGAQIDVRERNVRGPLTVDPGCDAHDYRPWLGMIGSTLDGYAAQL